MRQLIKGEGNKATHQIVAGRGYSQQFIELVAEVSDTLKLAA
jgi:hypothetical protein